VIKPGGRGSQTALADQCAPGKVCMMFMFHGQMWILCSPDLETFHLFNLRLMWNVASLLTYC
jgi:hypothetical protein